MSGRSLNLRDGLEGDEQYQVTLGRIAAVAMAHISTQRVNSDAPEADAIFVTGVLDLDDKASFELVDASRLAYDPVED